jgi:ketosteroid isomerase-like protein
MDVQEREAFAKAWLSGWNERDLERIVSHYADDVEFQSPVAVHLFGEALRTIKGKRFVAPWPTFGREVSGWDGALIS